ncbi:multiple epidermal growth factor-like domains protein 10 [Mercenaria mercenaria]|uniref:multiple epidermal growth factor-like domains protein 10 n=1 Tax=Mercenaria mercenaria TaxID=6596 RepID=UPI00234F5131|nr:multiple epidermal growth factor-like domains protein 10 [Mercenaria mercenaria]
MNQHLLQFGIIYMMFVFSLVLLVPFSVQVKAQHMTECDMYHHCLTCMGVSYNCSTCSKGYFLREFGDFYTCTKCPSQCLECESLSSCSACKIWNHYGKDCKSVCSKGCLNSTCDQSSGTCLCKDNYEGGHCDYCAKGKYGYECTMECPANCVTCHSDKNCTECKNGYHGDACKSKCPAGCVSCSSGTSCDQCKDGFWGDTCQHNCSRECSGGICLKKTGVCKDKKCRCDRCSSGRHGGNCNMDKKALRENSSAKTIQFQVCLLVVAVLFCSVDVTGTMYKMM